MYWFKLEDDVGMMEREGGKIDDKVIVAVVGSSLNWCWGGDWIFKAGVSVVDRGSWLQTFCDNSMIAWCSDLMPPTVFTGWW